MPDLPKLDSPDVPSKDATANGADPAAPPAVPRPRPRPSIENWAMIAAMAGIVLYGAAGFLKEFGLFDLSRWWSQPTPPPSLSGMSDRPAPPGPPAPGSAPARPLRDQPPRPPATDLPQFTVRDGETHDFLTDLDAETLKRLAEIQGQMDALVAQVTATRQELQALALNAGQRRQQDMAYQLRSQQDLAAARAEIAALQATVNDVEARFKRAQSGTGAPLATTGRPLPGWSVVAISGDRAWLRTPKGGQVTVVAGERLKDVGAVRAVDAARGTVVLADGRVVR